MRDTRLGIRSVALALILLPTTAGIVAIDASATCQRFVRTYVTVPLHKHVSKETATAWAKWRVTHPNWKPKANAQRSLAPLTREESIKKVNFTCDVQDPTPSRTDSLIALNPSLVPPEFEPPVVETSQISFPDQPQPGTSQITPNVTPATPSSPYVPTIPTGALPPIINTPLTTITPPTTDVTPEPSSLILLATGMIGLCGLFRKPRIG
jgi:hypothetical protein